MSFIFIYITNENETEAKKIAKHLLEKKLIACANFFPISSMYWWQGKIEDAKEIALIIKTIKENYNKVKAEVKKIHPYKIPCIIKIDVEANEEFEAWLRGELQQKP
jgi:periplasmic divalent cation tolerance protein